MRVPLSWLKEFAAIPDSLSAEEIADSFVRVGFEVEAIEYQGSDLSGPLVVGKVLAIEELSGHKKPIRWVELDCGEKETRFVICGATNFQVGNLVVVALPGAILPGNFAISQRETYGKMSNGMICSVKELNLGLDHSGILVLPPDSAEIGVDAVELLEIVDIVFEIAVNPDRGYALSIRGMAREIAAALGVNYQDPVAQVQLPVATGNDRPVDVVVDDPHLVEVIHLRTLSGFDSAKPTPLWMRRRLEKSGMRSISLAVDVTNYVMTELGQPLHAFDKDRIAGRLHIRRAGSKQILTTLDGQDRNLGSDDLVVADDKSVLALAGTMGGLSSEVTAETRNLVIEAARFDPISVSRNARTHKLFSEASKRFERGVDPTLTAIASARASALLVELGGATFLGTSSFGQPSTPQSIELDPLYPAKLTGAEISIDEVEEKLKVVGCTVDRANVNRWKVTPPSWRNDLSQPADLVEEVARMVGYEAIPTILPPHPVSPGLTSRQIRQREVSRLLADRGLVEIQTYPFISEQIISAMGYTGDRAKTFRILNPMSDDAPVLRTHLLPGLLQAAARNTSRGAKSFALFEVGTIFKNIKSHTSVHSPVTGKKPTQSEIDAIYATVPDQPIHVGGLLVGQAEFDGWYGKGRDFDWSDAVANVEAILRSCNLEWSVERSDFAPWHPGRCAEFIVNGVVIAHAGELHPRVSEMFGLPHRTSAFVVNLTSLPNKAVIVGKELRTFPVALQDIALIVDATVSAGDVQSALEAGGGDLLESVQLFDRYDQIGEGKVSLAFTLTFRAPDRTLTTTEVSKMRESAVEEAARLTGAILRSA
ncbi:MAG: phenylalanine--tRNA ligase subunit beta [Actinomycetota bacterium]